MSVTGERAFASELLPSPAPDDEGDEHGNRSYPQPDPYRPGLPLIREVKQVEDFEGQVVFGVGLERLACPTVLTLLSPSRVVLDFPTPP